MSADATTGRLWGNLATLGAYYGTDDLHEVMSRAYYGLEVRMIEKGLDFGEEVAKRRDRIMAEGG